MAPDSVETVRRSCDRPSCAAVATTWFAFDGRARRVQLKPIDVATGSPAGSMGLLCERHAARFTPPLGWSVDVDEPVRALPAAPPQMLSRAEPGAVAVAEAPPAPAIEMVTAVATTDDFDRLLEAESPLLARAFRTALDSRS
jgi:hypothetical protein